MSYFMVSMKHPVVVERGYEIATPFPIRAVYGNKLNPAQFGVDPRKIIGPPNTRKSRKVSESDCLKN